MPRWRFEFVKLRSYGNDDGFRVVSGNAVRDDNYVEGFDGIEVVFFGFAVAEIGAQNGVEASSGRGSAAGADGLENTLHGFGAGDVLVGAVIAGVEEVDVDAVFVVGGADGGDGCKGGGGFAPGAAGHGAGVID